MLTVQHISAVVLLVSSSNIQNYSTCNFTGHVLLFSFHVSVGQCGGVYQVRPCLSVTLQHWWLLDVPRLSDNTPSDGVRHLDRNEAAHRSQPWPGLYVCVDISCFVIRLSCSIYFNIELHPYYYYRDVFYMFSLKKQSSALRMWIFRSLMILFDS